MAGPTHNVLVTPSEIAGRRRKKRKKKKAKKAKRGNQPIRGERY